VKPGIPTDEILVTLRELSAGVSRPLWLFGGVAVDFLVGRWTRPHGDIDLNALAVDRAVIEHDLARLGYASPDAGWLTHWHQTGSGRSVEIVFLEQEADGRAVLVIRDDDPVGVPGRYPMVPGYLDPARFAELDGFRFRVGSPQGEWLARTQGSGVVAGRRPGPKVEHDRRLLETILAASELDTLRAMQRGAR
jgi:Aminoglycoside-2''-adenylyltransferase